MNRTQPNLVDSSAWLEYFADGPNAEVFAPAVENTEHLVVPTICLYEVFKRILSQRDEDSALRAVAAMQQGTPVDLTPSLALEAAVLSSELRLPMADSVILATARSRGAVLWTQDGDFEGLDGVEFVPKKKA